MGGKKVAHQNNPSHLPYNRNTNSARNLRKKDLAGVIFGCNHSTYKECISTQLFGLPGPHIQYVENITPGMPLFLFNYSDKSLHGIFEATSYGQMNINRHAWTYDDYTTTPYPAQVRVKLQKQCRPLCQDQYKPILEKNYQKHERNHLWFELDQTQTQKLISLFSSFPVSPSVSLPSTALKVGPLSRRLEAPIAPQERVTTVEMNQESQNLVWKEIKTKTRLGSENSKVLLNQDVGYYQKDGGYDQVIGTGVDSGNKWSSLFKHDSKPSANEWEEWTSEGHSTMSESPTDDGTHLLVCEMVDVAETNVVTEATFSTGPNEWGEWTRFRATTVNMNNESQDFGWKKIKTKTRQGREKSKVLYDQDIGTGADSGNKWSSLSKHQSTPSPPNEWKEWTSEGHSTMSESPHDNGTHLVASKKIGVAETNVVTDGTSSTGKMSSEWEEWPREGHSTMSGSTPDDGTSHVITEMIEVAETLDVVTEAAFSTDKASSELNTIIREVVTKLIEGLGEVKELQAKQTQKIQDLQRQLEEANNLLRKL